MFATFTIFVVAEYIVVCPKLVQKDEIPVEILVLDNPVNYRVEVYNALDQYCWTVGGDKSKENLVAAGCMPARPFFTKTVRPSIGWNEVLVTLYHIPQDSWTSLFIIIISEGQEQVQSVSPGEISADEALLISTDKSLYKPGDVVRFRVVPLHRNLRTFAANVTVDLISPDSMLLAKWTDIETENGFMKGEFPVDDNISDNFLGTCTLVASSGTMESSRTFSLERYTLQRFETTIEKPSYALNTATKIDITVRGQYTYGEGVPGRARLQYRSASDSECWEGTPWYFPGVEFTSNVCGWNPATQYTCTCDWDSDDSESGYYATKQPIIELTGALDKGSAAFEIDTSTIYQFGERDLCLRAYVDEDATYRVTSQSATSSLLIDTEPYKVVFEDSKCVPGFDYYTTIQFADPSGATISPPSGEPVIKVYKLTESTSWGYNYLASNWKPQHVHKELIEPDAFVQTEKLDESGGVIGLKVLSGGFNHTTFSLSIEIHYGDNQAKEAVLDVDCLYAKDANTGLISESRILAQASVETALVGDVVSFTYDEVGRSGRVFWLLTSGQATGPEPARVVDSGRFSSASQSIDITVSIDHYPELRFTIFAYEGTLLADFTTVVVNPGFTTTVANFSESTIIPGGEVSINVLAEGNSSVFIGVVDNSLLLSSTPNDIDADYVTASVMPPPSRHVCSYNEDANQALENSGLLLLASDFANMPISGGFDGVRPEVEWDSSDGSNVQSGNSYVLGSTTIQHRSYFPESWIWLEVDMNTTHKTLSFTAPDTITSWTMAAVSLGPDTGIGIANTDLLTTFKPFFVSAATPNEVIRNEVFDLNLTVFNYLEDDLVVDIECALPSKLVIQDGISLDSLELSHSVDGYLFGTWNVESKRSVTRSVPVMATTIGSFSIEMSGIVNDTHVLSATPGDAMTETLRVKPEGIVWSLTNNVVLEGLGSVYNPSWHQMGLNWPNNRVAGSEEIIVSLSGDLMGTTIASLDYLIAQPTGGGEQNMLLTAPQVYAYKYLVATDQLTVTQKLDIIRHLHTGYTRELEYMHGGEDLGGFSAFGASDAAPSTWLTAFVVSVFIEIMSIEDGLGENIVDPTVIQESASWLISKQNSDDGRFPILGRVLHTAMMGGVTDSDSLTCYVAGALWEAREIGLVDISESGQIDFAMTAVTDIITSYLDKTLQPEDIYPFSICAYTYLRAKQDLATKIYNKIIRVAKTGINIKWWDNKDVSDESFQPVDHCWDCNDLDRHPIAVEMSAYNLLSLLIVTDSINGRSISNWLLKQRNENGGFASTQDSCMALKALAEYAQTISRDPIDLHIELKLDEGAVTSMAVSDSNKHIYQIRDLDVHHGYPELLFQWRVLGGGYGTAYLGITQRYNYVPESTDSDHFDLVVDYGDGPKDCGKLSVDTKWMSPEDSGMVILNAKPMSGCCFDDGVLTAYENDTLVRMVEHECSDLTIYLDHLDSSTQSFTFHQYQEAPINNAQGQMVYVQQYYNPAVFKSVMYISAETLLANTASREQQSSVHQKSTWFIIFLFFLFWK